jgi:hypothetical protein
MPEFELSQATVTTLNGVLIVPDITVRLKSPKTFFLGQNPPPPSCPGSSDPLPAPAQPFIALVPSPSQKDPSDSSYQLAKLRFDQNAIGTWDPGAFDPCLSLVQVMQVTGLGPKDLMINLSCAVHQQQVVGHFARAALFVTEKSISVASAFANLIKRSFARPAHLDELPKHEASTSTR